MRSIACISALCLGLTFAATAYAQPVTTSPVSTVPTEDDFRPESLDLYRQQIEARFGGNYHRVPLDVKAEFFEWQLWRYHQAPTRQVYNRVRLPAEAGTPPTWVPGPDTSTWNGALLAALSYKYAVTKDADTLRRIAELAEGLHLFLTVTGQPGLIARSMAVDQSVIEEGMQPWTAPDGTVYHYRSDAAKGTYNQVIGGYATLMMRAFTDLPPDVREMVHGDLTAMVLHVVDHDYHLTERDGQRTRYGDLTPRLGRFGVPFNAQVAYQIVAAGHHFPPDDAAAQERINHQHHKLRDKYHVYYEHPLRSVVYPQRVGASPIVKGMNDRNHVTNAAFVGLALEIDRARRTGTQPDQKFLFQLGQTMYWSMGYLQSHNNSLCNFMWASILSDPVALAAIVPKNQETTRRQLDYVLVRGVEQLRRFKLDRRHWTGTEQVTGTPQWADRYRPDDYHWKCDPTAVWHVTGPATNEIYCAIDYLYAYWLMRYYQLEASPIVTQYHRDVVQRTPELASGSANDAPLFR